jgi:hypothetical protein
MIRHHQRIHELTSMRQSFPVLHVRFCFGASTATAPVEELAQSQSAMVEFPSVLAEFAVHLVSVAPLTEADF